MTVAVDEIKGSVMGLSEQAIASALDEIARIEPAFALALDRVGYPAPRTGEPGYGTLLRTIVGQQVSTHAARAVWNRLEQAAGPDCPPDAILGLSDEAMRAAGLSRQKAAYARSLADEVASGRLCLSSLPEDDEAAIAQLVTVKGIGRWSAEIYLLFAEGRPDIWPAGDLAVQIEVGRVLGLDARPGEKQIRALAEPWRPHRGAVAIFAWHHRNIDVLG